MCSTVQQLLLLYLEFLLSTIYPLSGVPPMPCGPAKSYFPADVLCLTQPPPDRTRGYQVDMMHSVVLGISHLDRSMTLWRDPFPRPSDNSPEFQTVLMSLTCMHA